MDRPTPGEKPLYWIASSKKDLLAFPPGVVDDMGYALGVVQQGRVPPSAKPWKGEGPGIFEVVEDSRAGTFRTAYTVQFPKAVYVLHCFQQEIPLGDSYGRDRCQSDSRAPEVGANRL